jgi:hypothetical protein
MSKLFFDHLLELEKVDRQIKKVAKTKEEREELWLLVDEIIHHKAIGCILDKLPKENHKEFLEMFHSSPHDEELLFGYLKGKVGENIEEIIKQELGDFAFELLNDIKK